MAGEVGDLIVKYQKQEFHITGLRESDTVEDLKNAIYKETNVHPDRQKLLGLKYKGGNPGNDVTLQAVKLKPNTKLMLIGSTEEEIESVKPPEDIPDVLNDFDLDGPIAIAVQHKEEFLAKVERRVETYKITEFNRPRPGKKLLVLDIDYTLFDHRSTAETAGELMRPYLHEFLAAAYVNYDIVIWSATGMKWIETKMKALGVSSHPAYKICFYLDSSAMISVHTEKYGVVEVKPLGVIWGKYKQWTPQNTIMFDDVRHNFLMNPRNGLRIRPFREAHKNRDKDTELLKLSKYLQDIVEEEDFTLLDHRKWEKYKKRKHATEKPENPPEGASPT